MIGAATAEPIESRPIPAMPPRPHRRLSAWELLKTASKNSLAICDEELFDELIVSRWYLLQPVIFVSDPVGIKRVLTDQFDNYPRVSSIRRLFEVELRTGTLASEGETWWRHRLVSTPSIDGRALRPDVPGLIALAETLAEALGPGPQAPQIDLEKTLVELAAPLWNHVVTGGDPAGLPILSWLSKVPRKPRLSDLLPKPKWLADLIVRPHRDPRIGRLDTQLRAMIDARREERYAGSKDLLWRLAQGRDREIGEALPASEVRDEAASIIAGGGSTSSRALTWMWYLLAHHPEVESRLHAELDTVLGGQPLRPEQISELPYTRRVLEEVMRLYPPIPAILRQAKRADTVCGHRVPRGAIVIVMPWIVHRHRKLWSDPDRFDPDRFTPENSVGRPRLAYLPFATGPRVCVGATFAMTHMLIVTAALARRFRVRLASDKPVVPYGAISLQPRGGLRVTLERR